MGKKVKVAISPPGDTGPRSGMPGGRTGQLVPGARAAHGQPLQVWLLKTQPVGLAVLPLAVK